MATKHRQFAPDEADGSVDTYAVFTGQQFIREQLSRETAEDDDPNTNADDVRIWTEQGHDSLGRHGTWIFGEIDLDQTPHEYSDGSLEAEFETVGPF